MTISVVIPAHNEEEFLEMCLKSVINQVEKADEIIVVDNNSTDKTAEIARKYKVKLVSETKQGISYARNKGFNSAKSDIIARCDADVKVPKDWIKKIKANFENHKIDALSGIASFFDDPLNTNITTKQYMDLMRVMLNGKETMIGPNMALTKEIWNKVKDGVCLDNKLVHEDMDLAIHIAKVGGKIRRDNSLVVEVSARRWLNNPRSGFIEYPARVIKTLRNH